MEQAWSRLSRSRGGMGSSRWRSGLRWTRGPDFTSAGGSRCCDAQLPCRSEDSAGVRMKERTNTLAAARATQPTTRKTLTTAKRTPPALGSAHTPCKPRSIAKRHRQTITASPPPPRHGQNPGSDVAPMPLRTASPLPARRHPARRDVTRASSQRGKAAELGGSSERAAPRPSRPTAGPWPFRRAR